MADHWLVMKFGGTSVAGKAQWHTIASLVKNRRAEGYRVLLVCSAMATVTNRLAALAEQPDSSSILAEILSLHRALSEELGVSLDSWLPEAEQKLNESVVRLRVDPDPSARASLLAMGEWMSTRIGVQFLGQELDAGWVDVREALEAVEEKDVSIARRWLSADCRAGRDDRVARLWAELPPVLITQGFIASSAQGETVLLGRGGSDTSSALLAGRLNARLLEIWTDVPGLFSADPRLIPEARLLTEVDYAEAQEMAASGARVVHPRCIRAAAETNTPIVIRDVNRRSITGTRIDDRISEHTGVKTITCQENMVVMLLQNLDARHHIGFLAQVFDSFRRHGISVDLVATSETTTTIAFNRVINHLDSAGLDRLAADLRGRCKVEVFADCVCVNLVGRGVRTALARLGETLRLFEQRPLLMLSQSANDLCLSILVINGDHESLLRQAHQALIPVGACETGGVFDLSWEEIRGSV